MIKLIAVDMDGTFLNSQSKYNEVRFKEIHSKLDEKGIHFVVASGNQYYQLKDFSPITMCAFGDGGNDLEMLREVGHGVAMKNADPALLEVANHVTDTNDEEGVLNYIEKNIL